MTGSKGVPADGPLPPGFTATSEPLVRARTRWVWIDPERGRPRHMPPEMHQAFSPQSRQGPAPLSWTH